MGYGVASGLAETAPLETAIQVHLTTNCYPPIPARFASVAAEAVVRAAEGEADHELVEFPEGLNAVHRITGEVVTAQSIREIIENFHLHAFVAHQAAENYERDGR